MKKGTLLIAGVVLLSAVGAMAQKMGDEGMQGGMMGGDSAMAMEHRAMMMGPGMAMGWMMMPRVVATLPDGSIIVQTGAKLIKYDKDLTMKKDVMVPIDSMSAMMMMHHMGHPMMEQK
jgi:hypothetical protein